MICMICHQHIKHCTCPDINERLASLSGPKGPLVFQACGLCRRHYELCRCPEPMWVLSSDLYREADEPPPTASVD